MEMNLVVAGVTFVAAGVEWVEALTIVLAVGIVRGWRSAFTGTIAAVVVLAAMVAVFGLALQAYLPVVRTLIGIFLLLFGLKWLHKAILRSAGLKPLHDEAKAFVETEEELRNAKSHWAGVATAFNGVLLEGLEVVFIVVAIGGLNRNDYLSPLIGAAASVAVVVTVGIAARRPLTQVPENTLKYVVGIMLTAFGTFFAGEGIGVNWPGSDLIIIALAVGYGLISLLFVLYLKLPVRQPDESGLPVRLLRAAWAELYGLFVDDSALAIITIAALLAVALFAERFNTQLAGLLLVVGVILAMVVSLSGPARARAAK
jgi:Ca2+/H+ antiporter, TMEM165/GDT1 family